MKRQQANTPQPSSTVVRQVRFVLVPAVLLSLAFVSGSVLAQRKQPATRQATDDVAMAAYADAANFQNGGALDLSIDAWNKFLKSYPKHAMAPQAAHYLGVCLMQKENPDFGAAVKAFQRALGDKEYDLRQESLANLGWCLYALAGDGEQRDSKRLQQSIDAFATLQKENPKSKFLDRSYFYRGEAAYGLGEARTAIEFYDKLLAMPDAKSSSLRCDALYARGVAQEELKSFDAALSSYRQLLGSCKREELLTDVHLRVGDMMIMQKDFDGAIESFGKGFASTDSVDDRSYALFRQAFALVQADRPNEAAAKYEQLLEDFPDSPFAGSAALAAAQSSYRGGDIDGAAKSFRRVLDQNDLEAATEAAHWLARIEIRKGNSDEAIQVVEKQLDRGAEGNFAVDLQLDLAEALSMDPSRIEDSMNLFVKAYKGAPDSPLAPRALYNAAFSALQLNRPESALEFAAEFVAKFPQDTLLPDVRFVSAESQLMSGDAKAAADTYKQLLASTARDNPQRQLWLLRAGATYNGAGRFEETIDTLTAETNLFDQPAQKAESYFLIGQAQLRSGKPEAASKSLIASRKADPSWNRVKEVQLLEGKSQLESGSATAAQETWKEVVASEPGSAIAEQALYQLAQLAASNDRYEEAVGYYDQILNSGKRASLLPYAQYGKGWALMQIKKFQPALEPLQLVLEIDDHPLRDDATLARGITYRNLNQHDLAKRDLEQYLKIPPSGTNLGHALYELALIDQTSKQTEQAAEKLGRLVREVPDYPAMDKVLYELGWSLQQSGKNSDAVKYFTSLIQKYPEAPLVSDAAYFIGQHHYGAGDWPLAASHFEITAAKAKDERLSEKAHYRLGWSEFKDQNFEAAEQAFADQASKHADGKLSFDALMMIGECRYKRGDYESAIEGFETARDQIRSRKETSKNVRDPAERRVRELVYLHGGQCAAQLQSWKQAITWYDELRERFPATDYLPQVFYETGFAYQQSGDRANALKFYQEVADNYRNELAARSRFMIGEIYFADREFDKAIPEFQRVMYGFGAEKAPPAIKNWQAKSGFEAGRCGEVLFDSAKTAASKQKSRKIASDFFRYVIEKHPNHELAAKSRDQLKELNK